MKVLATQIKSALPGAIAGGLVSVCVGLGTFLYTDRVSHERTAQVQTVLAFSDHGFPLADLAAKYVAAVTDKKPVDDLRIAMRGAIAQEILASENLRPVMGSSESSIDHYEEALN